MKFKPQTYNIKDESMSPFIDSNEIWEYLNFSNPTLEKVESIIKKSFNKERLSLADVAVLVNTTDKNQIELIKSAARELKEKVYGNRIVLFAPLYVGNKCSNNCKYCSFRAENKQTNRKTLSESELIENVKALQENGHKRLILVFGEHSSYNADYIANTVKKVYQIKTKNGEIRRVNINAAPLDLEGFKKVKNSGIGTYQIFQETYHKETYEKYHISGKKSNYEYRLTSLDRAMEVGIDDVGIGVLFGLYDWKFEILSLIRHVNHLESCFNVGPHTISFPRIQKASNTEIDEKYFVNDDDFVKIIAILRLAVPYTGLILTAREPENIRKQVLEFGCSQIDAGTKIEIGAYAEKINSYDNPLKSQFAINDNRSLSEVIDELIENGYLPSFCTACYRKNRTGEHFMEFSVPGFIKRFCTPNALLTLAEYLEDYASNDIKRKGWELIFSELALLKKENNSNATNIQERLMLIMSGKRDLYF